MPINRNSSGTTVSAGSGTLSSGTAVSVALDAGSLPREWSVTPGSGDTVRVEAYDGSTYQSFGDFTTPAYGTVFAEPGETAPTAMRFTRIAGSSTTSKYSVLKGFT